jgi:membrane protein DedA with SNARE-associated domain
VVERWLAHHEGWLLLFGRFIFGMGTLLPAAVGASGYAWRRFVVIDSLGALIWATTFACAGFAGAAGVRHWLGHPLAWSSFAVVGVLAVLCVFLTHSFMARHRRGNAPPNSSPHVE